MAVAKQIVHWPGKSVPACDEHLQQLVGVAALMGFPLTWTPCEETTCPNCEHAEKKAEAIAKADAGA